MSDSAPDTAAFARVLADIRADDPAGVQALRAQFAPGLTFFFRRGLGAEPAPELVREVLRAAAGAIQGGEPSDPVRLPGLVRAIARRILDRELEHGLQQRQPDPRGEEAASAVLKSMTAGRREVLERFYLDGQAPARVCSEMKLSPEQFQRLKSEARRAFVAGLNRMSAAAAREFKGRARAAHAEGEAG